MNGAANLLAVNQNLPFSHVVQAWDPTTGAARARLPARDRRLPARLAGRGRPRRRLRPGRARRSYGTGLYQLHAYGTGGLEPAGWPKFTGGWTQATPAVGDADGDGDLDVTALTREGWSFLWDTGVDACDGSNDEWWTFHHDEHAPPTTAPTRRPPGTPEDLTPPQRRRRRRRSSWTAPGDDWLCGKADEVRVLVSNEPIDRRPTAGSCGAGARRGGGDAGERRPQRRRHRRRHARRRPLPRRGRQLGALAATAPALAAAVAAVAAVAVAEAAAIRRAGRAPTVTSARRARTG